MYYALYHAVIAGFEDNGIKQSDLTSKVDPRNPKYWLHEVVRDFSTLADIERRDSWIVRAAYELWAQADYSSNLVDVQRLLELMRLVPPVMSQMRVAI